MGFLVKVLVTTLAVVVGSYILPGVTVKDFTTAIVVAFVLGILNAVLKPILVILTIPVTILTLGLFLLIINALIIMLTANLIDGFDVSNFWIAIIFSILISIISGLLTLGA